MTNKLAIIIGLLIAGALFWDIGLNEGFYSIFMARKGLDLIEWLAIWR